MGSASTGSSTWSPHQAPARIVAVAFVVSLIGVAACGPSQPTPTPIPSPVPSAVFPASPTATPTAAPVSVTHDGPLASAGTIVVLGNDGSLSLVDAEGGAVLLASADDGAFFLPAWSSDGSRIAAVRFGAAERSILVFDADRAASGGAVEPVVIFESSTIGPFYLSWTPDGESVSFLADEAGSLSLRIAPADGSAPLDGSGPDATIRAGAPLYFDWIERDRLLAHIGAGPDALLGEIGLDGSPTAPAVESPGVFRSAVVSPDRRFIGYVRVRDDGSEVVVAARDGSSEHAMPVFGIAAMAFDPTGRTIASIGPSEPGHPSFGVPIGPLRLIDAQSGQTRTVLDGSVASFWWSPDGKTIAALRVQPVEGQTALAASPLPSPSTQAREVRLLFVDVASGEIGAQAVVEPARLFIDQLLAYFDQYALSHHLWAPDSSSILIPVVDGNGRTRVAVMYRNGDPPAMITGAIGFWSP